MGRKKKPFIDKKKASRFHLVPRSQTDPLLEDPHQPQHVLKPEQPHAMTKEDRLAQQHHYGVHYIDDYDYLQHLKEPGTAVMEPVWTPGKESSLSLPEEVFGSEVKMEGALSKVLPITGPQPDWDPDIVAGLDNPDMNFDLDNQLEDDFVLQANGGEPGIPVYVTDIARGDGVGGASCEGGEERDMWWMERGDFSVPRQHNDQSKSTETDQSEHTESDQSDANSMKVANDGVRSKVIPNWCPPEEKVATFTNYSISSSVVPRNKGLAQLDERFETFMTTYDDSELGAPEAEVEGEGGGGEEGEGEDQWLLDLAVRDFEKNFADQVNIVTEGEVSPVPGVGGEEDEGERWKGGESTGEKGSSCTSGDDSDTCDEGDRGDEVEEEVEEERERREIVVVEVGKPEWDCESILSTYSNLYNHPTKIVEPPSSSRLQTSPAIALSRKTGIPLGTIPGPLTREKPLKQMPVTRPRHESREEKRERKKAVREDRKFRRSEKKATKVLFHTEQLQQEKLNFSHTHTAAVV